MTPVDRDRTTQLNLELPSVFKDVMLLLPSSGCSNARTPLELLHPENGHMSSGLI